MIIASCKTFFVFLMKTVGKCCILLNSNIPLVSNTSLASNAPTQTNQNKIQPKKNFFLILLKRDVQLDIF